ncbi:hypothetical protein K439DRAFT_1655058 [Ramaria rubella]|nr:hypothetical protein K439DRAFT_1655058 [Ramaria rubella]
MLGAFGIIAAVEIVFYVPVIFIAFFATLRHGFGRKEGWVSLLIFSGVRLLGAILSIASKTESNPSTGLLTAGGILQALGLSPLLLATVGFVTTIANYGLPSLTKVMRILRVVLVVGVILVIVGGTDTTPDNSASEQASGHTLSRVGVILFVVGYIALFAINVLLWGARENIPSNHKKLLMSLSLALPFLAVRVLYSVLGAFASPSQWSPLTGNWRLYLFMGVIMEYIVVCIYVITGARLPLQEEDSQQVKAGVAPNRSIDGLLEMGFRKFNRTDY